LEEIYVKRRVNACVQVLKCLQYPRNNCLENKWQTDESDTEHEVEEEEEEEEEEKIMQQEYMTSEEACH
jgi:hypothetical protein